MILVGRGANCSGSMQGDATRAQPSVRSRQGDRPDLTATRRWQCSLMTITPFGGTPITSYVCSTEEQIKRGFK
jgi:hypothetical protein